MWVWVGMSEASQYIVSLWCHCKQDGCLCRNDIVLWYVHMCNTGWQHTSGVTFTIRNRGIHLDQRYPSPLMFSLTTPSLTSTFPPLDVQCHFVNSCTSLSGCSSLSRNVFVPASSLWKSSICKTVLITCLAVHGVCCEW